MHKKNVLCQKESTEKTKSKKVGSKEKKVGKNGGKWREFCIFATKFHKDGLGMRFFGNIEGKLDAKGRVFLPAPFRKQFQTAGEKEFVLRTDISGKCLVLYPLSVWLRRVDALAANVSEWDEEQQMVLREFLTKAESCELDGNGRFIIPKRLLQEAAIGQAVRFMGMNETIEIWDLEKAEKPFVEQAEFSAKLKALMSKPRE